MRKNKAEYDKKYYYEHREQICARARKYAREHRVEQAPKKRDWLRKARPRIKLEIITYYGSGKARCIRCGFDDIRALTIDHIYGGGRKHREQSGRVGYTFYMWLKKQGYPVGYQTLCMNCQFIKKEEMNVTSRK